MTEEERFVDFATVRTLLLDAEKRRKNLTYEQRLPFSTLNGLLATLEMDSKPTRKYSKT